MLNTDFDEDKSLSDLALSSPPPNLPVNTNHVLFEAFPKQDEFVEAVFSGAYRYLLYGGAIRGGKSFLEVAIFLLLARIYPGSRWVICRATVPLLRRNVLPIFWKLCPKNFLPRDGYNQQTMTATFVNGSELIFFAEQAEDDPELTRLDGFEFNGIGLEEAHELQEKTFHKAQLRVGSWIMSPMPPMLIILTCNPHGGWLKRTFYDPWLEGLLQAPYYFLQAKIHDNPYIPKEFIEKLKDLPPELAKRFVEGSWDSTDEDNQLIGWSAIHKAEANLQTDDLSFSMAVDVGYTGTDPSVWTIMKGPNIYKSVAIGKTMTDEVVEQTIAFIKEFNLDCDVVGVDGVGVGAGVISYLWKQKYMVQNLQGGATPEELFLDSGLELFQFRNLRAQMAWIMKHDIEKGIVGGLCNAHNVQKLKDDLAAQRYKVVLDKTIQLLSKDEIKKLIHRSPDDGDSAIMCNWVRRKKQLTSTPGFVFG